MVTRIVQTTEFVTIQGNAIKLGVRGFARMKSVWNHLDNMLNTTYYNYKEEGAY